MTVDVNLYGESGVPVNADVLTCDDPTSSVNSFITLRVGSLSVILADAAMARRIAAELHRAADKLDGMPVRVPVIAKEVML